MNANLQDHGAANQEAEGNEATGLDDATVRFCNFMIMSARTEDGRRLFKEYLTAALSQASAHRDGTR